jgi:protein O-GlcNAc transferase
LTSARSKPARAAARTALPGCPAVCLAACLALLIAAGCSLPFRRAAAPSGPTSVDYYRQGLDAFRAGDRDAAVKALAEATRLNPDYADAHSLLGDIYKQSGDHASAATEYEAVTRLEPGVADNHHRLALSYHFLNRLRDAAASYLRAIQLNPVDWKSNMNLGLVYMALGDNNASVEHAQRAVNLNPLSQVAWANLGVTLDARGNRPQAEAAYRKALFIDPAQSTAAQNLVANLLDQGRPQDAIDVITRSLPAQDTPAIRRRYGDALGQTGRESEALEQYRMALKMNARFYPAMNALGTLLIKQYRNGLLLDDHKRDEALSLWTQSLQINPNQPKVEAQLRMWQPKAG